MTKLDVRRRFALIMKPINTIIRPHVHSQFYSCSSVQDLPQPAMETTYRLMFSQPSSKSTPHLITIVIIQTEDSPCQPKLQSVLH